MKNTDLRLQSINDFNERGETVLHFVRQDTTQIVLTMDVAEARVLIARLEHAIVKFEETDAANRSSKKALPKG